ncbi:MAG TPA: cation diffusion facilitator family transporter [Steroidobacteraceae bacterium]|nr:cation diffusion facilitator family transporter [Steroidobacteraceae bacterium]
MKDRLAQSHSQPGTESRRLGWALGITATFMCVEVVGGLVSGSLALLADAGHMLTDTAALALAWIAARLASRPTDSHRSYGYHRAQVLAAFVNALALFAVVAWIVVEAVQRLLAPRPIEGETMLGVALAGMVANVAVYQTLRHGDGDNINVSAARLHVLGDLLGSIGATLAALVILGTGWTPIDPILSVFVAVLIVRSAWSLLRKSTRILMEQAPESFDVEGLRSTLLATVPGVRDVHDVHCWSLTTGQTMLTLHVALDRDAQPARVLREAKHIIAERFDIAHSALQIEHEDCPDAV